MPDSKLENRLKIIRKYLKKNQSEMSKLLGLTQQVYSNYETGLSQIPYPIIEKIGVDFNINSDWLLTGRGEMFLNGTVGSDLALIDIINLKPGMGPGIETFEVVKIGDFTIEKRYLYPYSPDQVKAIFVSGDSMTPTLFDGDVVFYSPGLIRDNGIYILDVFGEAKCKRIEFRLDRSFDVLSDNERYKPESVSAENQSVRLRGKVIGWFHLHRY